MAHPYHPLASPWAHAAVCCDQDHGGSSSQSHHHPHPPITSHGQNFSTHHHHLNEPSGCTSDCHFDTFCCSGDYCCDQHVHLEGGDGKNEEGVKHEESLGKPSVASGDRRMSEIQTAQTLEEWAGTPEGCDAIQQLIECCNQPDCNMPVCPTENSAVHPPPLDPLAAIFSVDKQVQPIASASSTADGSIPPSHICHWGNCHLVFGSMPDLLAHVAADHLSAWNSAQRPDQLLLQAQQAQQQVQSSHLPTVPLPSPSPHHQHQQQLAQTAKLQQDYQRQLESLRATPAIAQDPLLSCMWDDCFPVTDIPASLTSVFHNHTHPPHPPLQAGPEHVHPNGEPFSPGTILRHVLEEHLGIPPDIVGWPTEHDMQNQQPPKHHHHHHIDPREAQLHHSNNCSHVHPHPHHASDTRHGLPTPPSTVDTDPSASPPSPNLNLPGKPLICLWPGCLHPQSFPDTSSLMDHLSEEHIPKGRDAYTCHWDGCGGEEGRVFKSRQKVLRHLQSHIGHKPFVCGVCQQSFSEAAPLTAHMRRHAQEKPFKCEHPGCGKSFAISSSLTIHMRTHNGEKPFVCPHCDKGFVEASNLTKHIRTHTGERPFACAHPGCGKKFSRPDQLKRHMIVHNRAPGEKRKGSGVPAKG
ncbi:hypothetical protein B9479_007883 [Cryptococcus floricola]|uniref:C2H2-type domain-containing protein n=1 Tax=Cryptococcus floricola TaxID=2591691 RepID=A0A5D3AJ35_9TREE|nr:hypothetical protein B9479_007883 [Cryptococcus floricola]